MITMFFRRGDEVWITDKSCVIRDRGQGVVFGVEVLMPPNFPDLLAEGRKGTLCAPTEDERRPGSSPLERPPHVRLGNVKLDRGYWFAVVALYGNKIEWLTNGVHELVAAVVDDVVVALVMPITQHDPAPIH